MPDTWVWQLVTLDSIVFAATYDGGLFSSHDFGAHWDLANWPAIGTCFWSLAVLGRTLFATSDSGLFISTDKGNSWFPASLGWHPSDLKVMTVGDSLVFLNRRNSAERLSCSRDTGKTWLHSDTGPWWVSAIASGPWGLVAVDEEAGLFYSTDTGRTWKPDTTITGFRCFALLARSDTLIVGGSRGIFRSTDAGKTWQTCNSGLVNLEIASLWRSGEDIFAGTGAGIFLSTDGGVTWRDRSSGITPLRTFTCFANVNHQLFGIALDWQGGLYSSLDNAMDWSLVNTGEASEGFYSLLGDCNIVLASMKNGQVMRSADFGLTWSTVQVDTPLGTILALASVGNTYFTGSDWKDDTGWWSKVYKSVDSGKTWKLTGDLFRGGQVLSFLIKDTVLLTGTTRGVYRSTDRGGHWSLSSEGICVSAFMNKGPWVFAAREGGFATTDGGVLRSSDDGVSWEVVMQGLPTAAPNNYSAAFIYALAQKSNTIFAGSSDGVYASYDDGRHWYHAGLKGQIASLFAADSFLVASVSGDGTYRRPFSELASVQEGAGVSQPQLFALEQNYPNPFNPATTIRYAVPHRSRVTLTVFNMLGQQAATLVSGEVEAGYHEVQFNGSGLASGVYFYRLQAGDFVQTRKLLLLK